MKQNDTGLSFKRLAKRNRRARRNLALKLFLERAFIPKISMYFDQIVSKVSRQVAAGQRPQVDTQTTERTKFLLREQYRRVARAFKDEMRLFLRTKGVEESLESKQEEEEERISEAVNMATAVFITRQSSLRGNLIDRTTQDEIEEVANQTIAAELEEGNAITGTAFAAVLTRNLRQRFISRVNTIAITETQFSSEKVKQTEAAVVSRDGQITPTSAGASQLISGRVTGDPETTKEWAAILDQVTREAHVIADGQTQSINEPFVVDSEFLMEPGDSSLGATAGNVINCRCSALYSLA